MNRTDYKLKKLELFVLLLTVKDKQIFNRVYKKITGERGASIWWYMYDKGKK